MPSMSSPKSHLPRTFDDQPEEDPENRTDDEQQGRDPVVDESRDGQKGDSAAVPAHHLVVLVSHAGILTEGARTKPDGRAN